MLSSSVFSNLRSLLNGKSNQPPNQSTSTTASMGSGTSQPVPSHLSQTKEEDDYLLVGATLSERSEVRPDQILKERQEYQISASPPPPSYQDVDSTDLHDLPGYNASHPAADIPFVLNPLLQITLDLQTSPDAYTIPRLAPLDMDKYLYDFTLEEEVRDNEGCGCLTQY